MILACIADDYFQEKANIQPLVWTICLMGPEAYTWEAALEGWMKNKTPTKSGSALRLRTINIPSAGWGDT
jgi:hypothetical protein